MSKIGNTRFRRVVFLGVHFGPPEHIIITTKSVDFVPLASRPHHPPFLVSHVQLATAFVPSAFIKGAVSRVRGASQVSDFAATPSSSVSTPTAAFPARVSEKTRANGVQGLKAVAMAETAEVVGTSKHDRMGEYIKSRGGSRPIRKVRECCKGAHGMGYDAPLGTTDFQFLPPPRY